MKTNIFKIAILALAISVSFSSCTKGDEPTPSNPNPVVVTPPTHIDSIKVDSVLKNSTWKIEYTDIYLHTSNIDTIKFVSSTEAIFVSNNNSVESLTYEANDSTFYVSKNTNYFYKYKFVSKVNDSTYIFTSGPGSMGDKTYSSTGHWNATFTKIN